MSADDRENGHGPEDGVPDAEDVTTDDGLLHEDTDPDGDTAEIPVVRPPDRPYSTALWLGAGAIAGIVGLVVFTGGLGPSSDADTSTRTDGVTATTVATTVTPTPATTSARTAPSPAPTAGGTGPTVTTTDTGTTTDAGTSPSSSTGEDATTTSTEPGSGTGSTAAADGTFTLRLGGRSDVFVEVRRGSEKGPSLFAGIVGKGTAKTFTSRGPLWLNISWAPNATIRIDGRDVPLTGGTEYYVARASGLRRVTDDG